jgi:muramoyltetrapeptide carboxypeptidase LdcA involved in peptidoglycan recycling
MDWTLPPALEPGDRVAVLAPSSGAAARYPAVRDLGLRRLRERFDLEPVLFPTATRGDDYLREHPGERARDIERAFADPDIRGVFATIGGDDQVRVLRRLDPSVLRANPTRYYGMSDSTALAALLFRERVVSFYGGQLMNELATPELSPYTERYLRRALFEDGPGTYEPSETWTDDPLDWADPDYPTGGQEYVTNDGLSWVGEGTVEGRLWGGCLGVLLWVLATDRAVPAPERLDGAVLAIETDEELPDADAVRRALTCLGERGLLARVGAVLVGRPPARSFLAEPPAEERERYRARQRETVTEWVRRYNPDAPLVFGLDFGHTNPVAPLPVGGRVRVDADARRIGFPGA